MTLKEMVGELADNCQLAESSVPSRTRAVQLDRKSVV